MFLFARCLHLQGIHLQTRRDVGGWMWLQVYLRGSVQGNVPVYCQVMNQCTATICCSPCVFCNDYVNAVTVIKFSFSTDVRPTPPSLQYVKCTMFLVNVVRRSDARPLRARRHPQSLADPPSGLISTHSVTTPSTTAKTTRRRWHVAESLNHGQDRTVTWPVASAVRTTVALKVKHARPV